MKDPIEMTIEIIEIFMKIPLRPNEMSIYIKSSID